MIIGSIGAGKTTLTNALLNNQLDSLKTQSLNYDEWIVDTPGEYIENPMHYRNIMATSLEVTHVFYIQDATKSNLTFPPGFSLGFSKLAVGVVTKADDDNADIERAKKNLKRVIGEAPIIITSAKKGDGLQTLRDLVKCSSLQEMTDYLEFNSLN